MSTAELLAPWLDHAHECMRGDLDDLAEPSELDEHLWISWNVPQRADGLDEWIFTLETIELLDLFVRVDYHAGWAWILATLRISYDLNQLDDLPAVYLKHTIDWSGNGSSLARAKHLTQEIPDELHTPLFRQARNEMMKRWGERERCPEDRVRVRLELDLEALADGGGVARACRDLVDLVTMAHDPSRRGLLEQLERVRPLSTADTGTSAQPWPTTPRPTSRAFQIHEIQVHAAEIALTNELLLSLCTLAHCGVRLSELTIDRDVHVYNRLMMQTTVAFLRSLLLLLPDDTHLRTLSIRGDLEISLFQAICSAVAASQTIRDVRLALPSRATAPAPDQYWAWIAYALLRPDRSAASVHLGVERLTRADVDAVERVLRARNPLTALGLSAGDLLAPREREVVDVRPHTTCLIRTLATNETDTTLTAISIDDAGCMGLAIVDDAASDTHVGVLYAGAGVCWVRRDDIVARRCQADLQSSSPTTCLPVVEQRLELEMGHATSLDALLALVQLIERFSSPTTTLRLFGTNRVELPDSFLRSVLASCSRLERLELTYVVVSSYAWLTNNERIGVLKLRHVESLDPQGYAPIFTALRDPTRGLGRSLRAFAIGDYMDDLVPLWPDFMGVLTTNRRLERVLVRMHAYDPINDADVEPLAQQLEAHHGEPLPIQEKPFPRRSRLALLSIFTHRRDLPALDEATLATIFALAAPRKRRMCGFKRR